MPLLLLTACAGSTVGATSEPAAEPVLRRNSILVLQAPTAGSRATDEQVRALLIPALEGLRTLYTVLWR